MELKVAHTMHQVYNSVQLYSLGAGEQQGELRCCPI
jgi:hypothetical protein